MAGHWPTEAEVRTAVEQAGSIRGAARLLDVAYETLRLHLNGTQPQKAGATVGRQPHRIDLAGDEGTVETTADLDMTLRPEELADIEVFTKRIGISEEFEVAGLSISNATGEPRVSLRLAKKANLPTLAKGGRPFTIKGLPRAAKGRKGKLVAIASDLHGRELDQAAFACFLAWLRQTKPDEVILAGDLMDLPNISKYLSSDLTATVQEELDTTFDALAAIRANVPQGTTIKAILGNHDIRLDHYVISNAPAVYGLRKARTKEPVLSIPRLLRFDELGIEAITADVGDYPHPYIQLTDELIVEHGSKARKGGGSTPRAAMADKPYGVIHGHTHRLAVLRKAIPQAGGGHRIVVGAEVGCLCSLEPNYAPSRDADWAQGWAAVSVWEDGLHDIELISYREGYATFRGERFSADD